MKRFLTVLFLIAIAFGAHAGAEETCTETSPLEVLHFQTAWEDVTVDLENTSLNPTTGGIVVTFAMNGHNYAWWFDTDEVPASALWEMQIEFPSSLVIYSVSTCARKPGGIVEAPDPVAQKVQQQQK